MGELNNIANNQIKNIADGTIIPLENLWKDQTTVIIFFRRWGCMFCRVWAKEVAAIHDILKENNVKLVGIGVEEFGSDEFAQLKFFPGDLYVDTDKKTYADLGFKRFSAFSVIKALFTAESKALYKKGKELNVPGNLKGDGLQNGGALIVKKGGELLYSFKQNGPGEHVKNSKFLEVLGIPIPDGIDDKTV